MEGSFFKLYYSLKLLMQSALDISCVRPMSISKLLLHSKRYYDNKTYFPQIKQKSHIRIFFDQVIQTLKYSYPNYFYFAYGLDVKDKRQMREYLHYSPFCRKRDYYNNRSVRSSTLILRDKLLFGMFTSFYGIASAANLAVSKNNKLFNLNTQTYQSVNDFFSNIPETDIFLKPVDGACGRGIYHMRIVVDKIKLGDKFMEMSEIENILSTTTYLVQTTINQHELMKELHHQSLNTIRLVTIRNRKTQELEVFPSILRIGTGDSVVDNTSQGGLAVGIELDSGKLKDFGFYKPGYGTKVSVHPDSGIRFSDFTIPYFSECKQQALFLHSQLGDVHSIGWDIAIGENGPIFVEGNDNWEINGPQICNGGLKKEFLRLCGEI